MNEEIINDQFTLTFTEQQEMVRSAARDFAENEIRARVMEFDEPGVFPMEIFRKMGDLGFLGVYFPEELGGAGLGAVEYCLVVEEISRVETVHRPGSPRARQACSGLVFRHARQNFDRSPLATVGCGFQADIHFQNRVLGPGQRPYALELPVHEGAFRFPPLA